MPRYKLTVEYDGAAYCGFQRQLNGRSVQGELEVALKGLTQQDITVYAAGRTDAGVHALGQVCHVDLPQIYNGGKVAKALNFYLQDHLIVVREVREVPEIFHARFSAIKRHYLYRINNLITPPAIKRGHVWHVHKPLDVASMQKAATALIGHHDFSTFRASYCQAKSAMRTIDAFDISTVDDEVNCSVSGRSFLHHQVRNMVGALYWVGRGQWTYEDFLTAFHAKNRAKSGPTVPAHGLFLTRVDYPDDDQLPDWRNPLMDKNQEDVS